MTTPSPILYKFRKARAFVTFKSKRHKPPFSFMASTFHEKQPSRGLGWIENTKNYSAEPSDEEKLPKKGFPRPRMRRKHQKQTFRALGWIENEKFHASEPSDE